MVQKTVFQKYDLSIVEEIFGDKFSAIAKMVPHEF